jgi:hypothetical protein
VDGALVQRVEAEHNFKYVKRRIAAFFEELEDACHVLTLTDQRICALETNDSARYRVADVCLVRRPFDRVPVLRRAPLLVAEVLRPGEDTGLVLGRLADFARMGVPHLWAVDVEGASFYTVSSRGLHEVNVPKLPIPELNLLVSVRPFFRELN